MRGGQCSRSPREQQQQQQPKPTLVPVEPEAIKDKLDAFCQDKAACQSKLTSLQASMREKLISLLYSHLAISS